MPSVDRNWRNRRRLGYSILVLTVAAPIAYLLYLTLIWGSAGAGLTHVEWSYLWMPYVGVIMGFGFVSVSHRGEARQQLRMLAMAGDQQAMPPAAIESAPLSRADATRASLALLWRPSVDSWLPYEMILLMAALATFLGAAFLENALALPSVSLTLAIATPVVALEVGFYVWWWLRRRRLPHGVLATQAGLRWLRPGNPDVFIPWSEARLFEVWRLRTHDAPVRGWALLSERALIQWHNHGFDKGPAADGADDKEILGHQQALVQMIAARTGLIPRTCESTLAAQDSGLALARQTDWWRGLPVQMALIAPFVVAPLVAVAGALFAPLTVSLLLNIYAAAPFGAAGLFMLAVGIGIISERLRSGSGAEAQRPDVRLPAAPPAILALRLRAPYFWRNKRAGALVGLLTVGEIYVLMRSVADFPSAGYASGQAFTTLLGYTLFMGWMFVLFMSVFSLVMLFDTGMRVSANEWGLRSRRGFRSHEISWDMVMELVITVNRGRVKSYRAIAADVGQARVEWPADALWAGVAPPMEAESPGAVFAAAVAQRAGVTPRVEYE